MTTTKFRSSWVELVCRNNMCGKQYRTRVRGGATSCPDCGRGRYVRRDQEPEWTTAPDRPTAPPLGRSLPCQHCDHVITTRAKIGSPVKCPVCKHRTRLPSRGPSRPAPVAPARRPAPAVPDAQVEIRDQVPMRPARPGRSLTDVLAPTRRTMPAPRPSRPALPSTARTVTPPPAEPVTGPTWVAPPGARELAGFPIRPARSGRCQIAAVGCSGSSVFRWGHAATSSTDVQVCETCSRAIEKAGNTGGIQRFYI